MARSYSVAIKGTTPLLMHWDNIDAQDQTKAWLRVPANKAQSIPGDDRSPAWTWIGSLYHDGDIVSVPFFNLMACIQAGATRVPTGKRGATFKKLVQSGIVIEEEFIPLITGGKQIPVEKILKLMAEREADFSVHQSTAAQLGFELYVRRAVVGASKHVRVRPRFNDWGLEVTLSVHSDAIREPELNTILSEAGRCGIGDWRPSAPKNPGPFGQFIAEIRVNR